MNRSFALLLAVLSATSACSAPNPVASIPPSVTPDTTFANPLSTRTQLVTPTEPPRPTLEPSMPQVVTRCPVPQEVGIDVLGLNLDFPLLVAATTTGAYGGAFLLSRRDPVPHPIPIPTAADGWPLSSVYASPSGQWLVIEYSAAEGGPLSLWFGSLDTHTLWEVATLNAGERPYFASDRELVVLGDPEDDLHLRPWEYVPLYSIDPFTGERTNLAPLPHVTFFDFYFTDLGESYAGYEIISDSYAYYLYDYGSGTSRPIFRWLDYVEGWYPLIPSPHRRYDGLFMVTVGRSYGFDIAADVTLDQALGETSYRHIMRPIVLPGGENSGISTYVYEDVVGDALPVIRQVADRAAESLYMFNYRTMILSDYCLDFNTGRGISVSPDGRFLATSLVHLTDENPEGFVPYAALVLDIESGNYARIDGFLSLSWVADRQ